MYDFLFNVNTPDQQVSCKALSVSQYLEILSTRGTHNIEALQNLLIDILDKNTNAKNISKHSLEMLIIVLIAKSINEGKVDTPYNCACGRTFSVPIDYSSVQIGYPKDYPGLKEPLSIGSFKVRLKYPSLFEDQNIYSLIVNSLDQIMTNEQVLKIDELSDVELETLQSLITTEHINKIKDLVLGPKPYVAVPVKCECGKSEVHVIDGFNKLFKAVL
ncbi:gp26 baseplate hub subunit [Acinetobacter phage Ac42]|uniref:baseplate hub n=1 Tax=Acinetobacter phage Ac42 TaxID=762660 RepID=UPI0001EBCDBB|nr:baseplate hub [Acinetobacter phage Ac42]ADI96431.1 gp26 baseplate hub subunit [Acinetobacter phage Ac42]